MEIFPTIPDDLSTLSDDDLHALRATFAEVAQKIEDGEFSEVPRKELNEAIAKASEDVEKLDAEIAEREVEDAEKTEALAKLKGDDDEEPAKPEDEAKTDDDEPAGETDDEPAGEEEPAEEIAASAAAKEKTGIQRKPRITAPGRSKRNDPRDEDALPGVTITAAAGLKSIHPGEALDSPERITKALTEAIEVNRPNGSDGSRKVIVASIQAPHPEERYLHASAGDENLRKLEAVIGPERLEELTAAGGLCAPLSPRYELEVFGVADRPVRDSFPRFGADRGGIRFPTPLSLADVNTAVWSRTAAQDAAGYVSSSPAGATPDKTFQRVPCPAFNDVVIGITGTGILAGNLLSRVYPEAVRAFQDLVAIAFARTAEVKLLDRLKATAKSAAQNPVQQLGLVDYAAFVIKQAAIYRNRHRLGETTRLVVLAPLWLQDAWAIDQLRGNRFVRNQLTEALAQANVTLRFYLDSETGGNQIVGAQDVTITSSEWAELPANAISYMWADGAYVYLDGGQIDLGMIVDSALAKVNDVEFFMEEFSELAFTGNEALRFETPVCPSGASAAAVTFNCALDDRM